MKIAWLDYYVDLVSVEVMVELEEFHGEMMTMAVKAAAAASVDVLLPTVRTGATRYPGTPHLTCLEMAEGQGRHREILVASFYSLGYGAVKRHGAMSLCAYPRVDWHLDFHY